MSFKERLNRIPRYEYVRDGIMVSTSLLWALGIVLPAIRLWMPTTTVPFTQTLEGMLAVTSLAFLWIYVSRFLALATWKLGRRMDWL